MKRHQRRAAKSNWLGDNWDVLIAAIVILYFGVRLVYFAVSINPAIPPDEVTHAGRCQAYSKVLLIPEDGADTYELGLVSHRPFLYYWLMGKVLHLNFAGLDDLIFLRLINGLFGILIAFYAFKWIRLVSTNKLVRVVTVIIMTNILFVTGLFACVNYDNLTNLLSVMSLYYLTLFFDKKTAGVLALFLVCMFAGCITKITFLPLALVLLFIFLIRGRKTIISIFASIFKTPSLARAGGGLAVLFFFSLSCILYGGNIIRYGSLKPSLSSIVGVESAMQYRLFARDYIVGQFRKGNYTYEYAVEQIQLIKNPTDRNAALSLLQHAREPEKIKNSLVHRGRYTTAWFHGMLERTVGYTGHQFLMKSHRGLYPYHIILVLSGIMLIRKFDREDGNGHMLWIFVATSFYILVLMWYVNYPKYVRTGTMGLAFTGRYMFPVLVPICGLISYYLISFLPRKLQVVVAVVVSAWFVYGDFIFFVQSAGPKWFI